MLKKRIKRALELRRKGLSFNQIGQDLGVGSERARQIVRNYQRHLKSLEDPFIRKIKELSRMGDATRIFNALKGNDFYEGNPGELAHYKREDLMKIRGLGTKRVAVIAMALKDLGVIKNAEDWLKR